MPVNASQHRQRDFVGGRLPDDGISTVVASVSGQLASVSSNPSGYNPRPAGSNTQALTLVQAVYRGLSQHPEVQSAMAEVAQSSTEIGIANSGYYPRVTTSAGPENGVDGEIGYNLTVSQVVFDWGRVKSDVDAATATKRKQESKLLAARSKAALEILEVCFDLEMARRRLEAVNHYSEQLQSLHQLVQHRNRGGYSDNAELARVKQALGYVWEQRSAEASTLMEARSQLSVLLNMPARNIDVLIENTSPELLLPLSSDDFLSAAIGRSPKYREAQEEVAYAQAKIDNAKAASKPRVQLEATAQRREIGGVMTEDSVLTLRFRMEPMQGLSLFKRTEAEHQRLESALWSLGSARRELQRQIISYQQSWTAFRERLLAMDEQLSQVVAVRESYREKFLAGYQTIDDLISIERENFEVARQKVDLYSEYRRIPFRIAADLGLVEHLLAGKTDEVLP